MKRAALSLLFSAALLSAHGRIDPNPPTLFRVGDTTNFTVTGQGCTTVLSSIESNPGNIINVAASPSGFDLNLRATLANLPPGDTVVQVRVSWTTNCPESGGVTLFNIGISPRSATPPTASGPPHSNSGHAGDPVSTATGEYYRPSLRADLLLHGPLPIEFHRHYAAFLKANGVESALGDNWMHNYDLRLLRSGNNATVTLFTGKPCTFTLSGGTWNLNTGEKRSYQLIESGGVFRFLDPNFDRIYSFNSTGQLTAIENRNGATLTITPGPNGPTQVSDGLGRSLRFTYAGARLSRVEDHTGRAISFQHSGNNLVSFTDAAGARFSYAYAANSALMTSETMPEGNVPLRLEYDSQGRVTRQLDSRGNAIQFAYDTPSIGRTTIRDAAGQATIHTHQGSNYNMTGWSDAAGATMAVAYDSRNNPISQTDRGGRRTLLTYDVAGNVISHTDPSANTTRFTWISQVQSGFTYWLLASISHPDGSTVALAYDTRGNLLARTDRAGKTLSFTYDSRGWLTSSRNTAGGVTQHEYNADGTRSATILPSGEKIAFEFDAAKRLTKVTFSDQTSVAYSFDALDRLTSYLDERGKRAAMTYTANGWLRAQTDTAGQTTTLAYDTDDRLASITDPLGRVQRRAYDSVGRLLSESNAAGEARTHQFDALGRMTRLSDPLGSRMSLNYAADGRLQSLQDPAGRVYSITTDPRGLVTESTDGLNRRSSFTYDAMYRRTTSMDPLGNTERSAYLPSGLASITLPGAITARFERNDLHQILVTFDPNGGMWRREIDNEGRLLAWIDPLGRRTAFTYGARNRVSRIDFPGNSATHTYDPSGNLLRLQYTDGLDLNYTYDDRHRLSSTQGLALSYDAAGQLVESNGIRAAYDSAGRLFSLTYAPRRTVSYTYNGRGLVTQVRDWLNGVFQLSYDNTGRLTVLQRPNGVTLRYGYDANGDVESITEAGPSWNATIALRRDAAGRITASNRSLPSVPILAAVEESSSFDAAHQSRAADMSPSGRVLQDASRTYVWDAASRLASFDNGSPNPLRYDGLGNLIAGKENYVWNFALALPSIAIMRSGEADQRYYIHLPNGHLLASIDATGTSRHFFHYDEAGNTLFLTNAAGVVTDTYAVTPYGEVLRRTGSTANPFTFQGAFGVLELDSGLYSMRARVYDAQSARFLSRDPVSSSDPLMMNPYQYARDNPIQRNDPTGHVVRCVAFGGTFVFAGGGSVNLQYCKDHCGNWGCFLAVSMRLGVDVGIGFNVSEQYVECIKDITSKSTNTIALDLAVGLGPVAASVGFWDQNSGFAVSGISGSLLMGLDAGVSLGFITVQDRFWGDTSAPCPCTPLDVWTHAFPGFRFAWQVPPIPPDSVVKPVQPRRGGTMIDIGPSPYPY